MSRDWLKSCHNIKTLLTAAERDEQPERRWSKLRTLCNFDLDLPSTIRLGKAIIRAGEASDAPPQGFTQVRLAILSTSTIVHLPPGIRVAALGRGLHCDVYEPAYGQFRQEIANTSSGLHVFKPNAVLIAYDCYSLCGAAGQHVLASAADAQSFVKNAVDELRGVWRMARETWDATIIQQVPLNPFPPLMGENEARLPGSPFGLLRMFQNKIRSAASEDGVDLVDLDRWAQRDGIGAWHSTSLWHRAKQEVHPAITPVYGDLVARVLAARYGRSAKCLVLDLDNTLWGGVIGDDGLENIVLGQGSPAGEGYLAFQKYAKQLGNRGIILAVCSKNDDAVAKEPFEKHPEMALKIDDIACFVANWTDKATNIRRIAAELNIGIDALVFADDNPFERELIASEIPDMFVPNLPEDPSDFSRMISDSGYFECVALTKEDLAKTEQYRANARRHALLEKTTDLDGYLAALDMTLRYGPFDDVSIARTVQLINKTNQFNLTTRRYSEAEVRKLITDPRALTFQMRLLDRFGDNGIIAILIGKIENDDILLIETWLMSCRVLGRDVEKASLKVLVDAAKAAGVKTIIGEHVPTSRNGMVKDHYRKLGFTEMTSSAKSERWSLAVANYAPPPIHIEFDPIAVPVVEEALT